MTDDKLNEEIIRESLFGKCISCSEEEANRDLNMMLNKARQQGAEKMLYTIEHFFVIQTKNKFTYKEIHEFLEQLKNEARDKEARKG